MDFAYLDKGTRGSGNVVYSEEDYEGLDKYSAEQNQSSIEYGGIIPYTDKEPSLDDVRQALKNPFDKDFPPEYKRQQNETDVNYENRILDLERKKFHEHAEKEAEDSFWNELEACALEKAVERTGNLEEEDFSDEDAKAALVDMMNHGTSLPGLIKIDPKDTPEANFQKVKLQLNNRRDQRRQRMESIKKTDLILKGKKSSNNESLRTIIEAGTQYALDEVYVNSHKKIVDEEIKLTSRAACIEVESARFSGYLIAVMANTMKMDESFISFVRNKLKDFLKKSGEEIKENDNLELKLQEVQFTDWALSQAEFLRRTVYDGKEIALAFFPADTKGKALGASKRENMLSMEIDEIRGDTPVEFDLHIYLPTNDKYILYTSQGEVFGSEQKNRLMNRGINKVHLPKTAVKDVKRYRVQNFLNDKIKAYKEAML